MVPPQADAKDEQHRSFQELTNEIQRIRPPLVEEYNSIVLRPIIWNTLANLKTCILNKSFGTLLEALDTQLLKTTDEKKKKVLHQLRKDAAAYLKSKPADEAKKLQDIENCFIENLKNISLPPQWEINFDDPNWKDQAQSKAEQLVSDGIANLKEWRAKPELEELNGLIQEKTKQSCRSSLGTPKTRLQNFGTHPSLIIMLTNFKLFERFLKVVLEKYEVESENGERKQIYNINEQIQKNLDTPLHYAVRDLNESFTQWLLKQEHIDPNCRNKFEMTPLVLICKQYDSVKRQTLKMDITTQQLEQIEIKLKKYRTFIRMLQDKGASFVIPSKILQSFAFVLSKRLFNKDLKKGNKNTIERKGSVKTRLESMQTDEEKFMKECSEKASDNDFDLMECYLQDKDLVNFKNTLHSFSIEVTEFFVKKLIKRWLHTAVNLNLKTSVNLIISKFGNEIFLVSNQEPTSDAAVNKTNPVYLIHRAELKGLLRKACENPAILMPLLSRMDKDKSLINDELILLDTLKRCVKLDDNNKQRKADNLQCAKLLANNKRIDITKTDDQGNTALHIALKYGLEDIAMTICTKHPFAFLGIGNKHNETPLDYAKHAFLEEYLDKTVQEIKGHNTEFKLDYNGFCPYYLKELQQNNKVEAKNPNNDNGKTLSAVGCIKQISNSSKLKPLLKHPVIKTFVQIQWLHWSIFHVLNLLFTVFTAVCFIFYTSQYFCHGYFSIALYVLNWFGCLFFIIRELFQWAVFGSRYFRQHENLFDIINILLMFIILSLNSKDVGILILLAALNVIIFAYQIICLAGALSVDIFSTYIWMLLVVAKNFFLSIFAFCPILLAFYYSFYLVYNRLSTSESSNTSANNTTNDTFNTFGTTLDAGVKILVMTIGELDAAAIKIDPINVFIFIPFILIVSMIIQNLINGLAVSDISVIRSESELINLSNKVHLLARIESGLDRGYLRNNIPKIISFLKYLPQKNYSKFFFQKYSHIVKITVEKNDCAKIMILHRNVNDPKLTVSYQNQNTEESERGDRAVKISGANQTVPSDVEARNTIGEGSHLIPSPDENQPTIIDMSDSDNIPPIPCTVKKQKPPQEPWIYILRRGTFKILTLDKTVLRDLQRIAD